MSRKESRRRARHILAANARSYCETTTIHGFGYWVSATRRIEKVFWVIVVIIGFVCASLIIKTAVEDWQQNPGVVTINSFSKVFGYTIGA
jgi:formate-dependent nitrite reductase membrane component NrfD